MPPPGPNQSVFATHAAAFAPCEQPADVGAARSDVERVFGTHEGLAHLFREREDDLEALRRLVDYVEDEVETVRRELEGVGSRQREIAEGASASSDEPQQLEARRKRLIRALRGKTSELASWKEQYALQARQLEIDRAELNELEPRLPALRERLEKLEQLVSAPTSHSDGTAPLHVSPTGLNTSGARPRYFRVLVWNLENFTRDPRPRGSAAVDSLRNRGRIEVAARLAVELGADAVLVMETGSDVGAAMTHMAARVQAVQPDEDGRSCEPLVSAATHAVPVIELDYAPQPLGRVSGSKALALRTLLEAFEIRPHAVGGQVTEQQLRDACRVLVQASPEVRASGLSPHDESAGWADRGWGTLENGNACPGIDWLWNAVEVLGGVDDESIRSMLQILRDQFLNYWGSEQGITDQDIGTLREVILMCRSAASSASGEVRAALLLLELGLLFGLVAYGQMALDAFQEPIWSGTAADVAGSFLPLASFLCARQPIAMHARDRDLGPLVTARDPEVLLHALRRAGIVRNNYETYGMLYRPWAPDLLESFFGAPCRNYGVDDRVYRVLREDSQGNTLRIQESGGVLSGRSALLVQFPVGLGRWVPIALHHNRFTGTAEIGEMDDRAFADNPYSKDDKVLRARVLSLLEIAKAGAQLGSPPLIVGDFNLPASILEESPPPDGGGERSMRPYRRRVAMRWELELGMRSLGYVRRAGAGGNPRTSLSSYATIAAGDGLFSEPYDAAYQPFDFLGGTARVRSGVVTSLATLFTDDVLSAQIEAPAPDLTENQDVDLVAEDDDEAEELPMDVMDDSERHDPGGGDPSVSAPSQVTVTTAMAFEIRRVYRSLHRQAVRAIRESLDWFRVEVLAETDAWDSNAARVQALLFISGADALDQAVEQQANEFYEALCADIRQVLDRNGADPMDAWIEGAELAVGSYRRRRPSRALQKLPDTLSTVQAQLRRLETDPERRAWVGYRALVSDHLPLLVEIDLAGG